MNASGQQKKAFQKATGMRQQYVPYIPAFQLVMLFASSSLASAMPD